MKFTINIYNQEKQITKNMFQRIWKSDFAWGHLIPFGLTFLVSNYIIVISWNPNLNVCVPKYTNQMQ